MHNSWLHSFFSTDIKTLVQLEQSSIIQHIPTVKCNETPITRRYTEHPRHLKIQMVAHICGDITSNVKFLETTIGNKNRQFKGGASFVDHLCYFCLVYVMLPCASVYYCLVVTSRGRGLTSLLSFVMSHWYPGSGVVLDCIDS